MQVVNHCPKCGEGVALLTVCPACGEEIPHDIKGTEVSSDVIIRDNP